MKFQFIILWVVCMLFIGNYFPVRGQTINTVAGDGTTGITGSGIGAASGVAVDASGNIYVATGGMHVVRKITPDNTTTTFAGTEVAGFSGDNGLATSAQLNSPIDLYVSNNTLYIADQLNRRIRSVDLSTNTIKTVAGDGTTGITGSGIGAASGVAVDASGNIYVATGGMHVVRKITPDNTTTTFAGTEVAGFSGDNGLATSAQLNSPIDLYVSNNTLYIADQLNRRIRSVDLSTNMIKTVAGDGTTGITGSGIGAASGVVVDASRNIYVATGGMHVVRKITPDNTTTTIAGTGTAGFSGDGGSAIAAMMNSPIDLYIGNGKLYIADQLNRRIRTISGLTLLSVEDIGNSGSDVVEVYPNPTSDWIYVKGNIQIVKIEVFDSEGALISASGSSAINLDYFSDGVYIVRITDSHGNRIIKKVVKK